MSKPLMNDKEYEERKNNLLKNAMNNENKFLEYVLFCVISNRGYTLNNLITDLSDARLEIKNVIDVYIEFINTKVYFDFLRDRVPLNILNDILSPLKGLIEKGISLMSILSRISKYKEEGYNTSNIGNLIEQIISGKPIKSTIPSKRINTFENKPHIQEEMIEVNRELDNFLSENKFITVNNVQVKLPESIEKMDSNKFNKLLKDNDIDIDIDKEIIKFSDGKIYNSQSDPETKETIQKYLELTGSRYPFIIGLVIILKQDDKLSVVKNMIDIEEREQQLQKIQKIVEQKEQEVELKKQNVMNKEKELEMKEQTIQQNLTNVQNQQNTEVVEEIKKRDERIKELEQNQQNLYDQARNVIEQKEKEKEMINIEKEDMKKKLIEKEQKVIQMEIEQRKNEFIKKGEEIGIPFDFGILTLEEEEMYKIGINGIRNNNIVLRNGELINIIELIGNGQNAAIFEQYVKLYNQIRNGNVPSIIVYLALIRKYNKIGSLVKQIESILNERKINNSVYIDMIKHFQNVIKETEEENKGKGETETSRNINEFIRMNQDKVPDIIMKNEYVYGNDFLECIRKVIIILKSLCFDINDEQISFRNKVANIKDVIIGYDIIKQLLTEIYQEDLKPSDVLILSIIMIENGNKIFEFLKKISERIIPPMNINIYGVTLTDKRMNQNEMTEITRFLTERGIVMDRENITTKKGSIKIKEFFGNNYEIMQNYVRQIHGISDPSDTVLLSIYIHCIFIQDGDLPRFGAMLQKLDLI